MPCPSGLTGGDLVAALLECGLEEDDALAGWSPFLSPSELESVVGTAPCQREALRHVRAAAREMHGRALPYLLKRVGDLGFAKKDLDLHSAFLWIRDAADVVCHVDLSKIAEALASDTHYRRTSSRPTPPRAC
ncbi:unnamed protein product [Prorocentrum cordatum]|uniref:Uncharacterized protein n=1 Tax=Prorocentrum cordatum TaxID=2364126 RepID=A0ABN9PGT6_9DINO|nr:unnamed protein product [Polarella glacialis]